MTSAAPSMGDNFTVLQHLNIALGKFENKSLSSLNMPASLADYDDLLNRLYNLTSRLATHRNTLAPINRLPVDVLSQIFGMVQVQAWYWVRDEESFIFRDIRYSEKPAFSSWLKLFTEVCHHWREITTSTKRFWQNICLQQRYRGGLDLMKLFLARSSPLPFRLRWYHGASDYRKDERATAWSIVKKEAHRLELLHVLGPLRQYPEFSKSVLDIPAPQLRYLSLITDEYQGLQINSSLAPNLQGLELQGAASLANALFPNITHLCLSEVKQEPETSQFLQLLRSIPLLQQLQWHQRWPVGPGSLASYHADHNLQPVALPHLAKIELYNSHLSSAAWEIPLLLLYKLELPDSVEIHWNSTGPPPQATLSVEPVFHTAKFLLREGSTTSCTFHRGLLEISNINLLGPYGPHLPNIRAFASLKKLPENMMELYPQISASPVEEFHLRLDEADHHLFDNLEQSHPPLFPMLRVFSLWIPQGSTSRVPSIFQANGQFADVWKGLLETGQATRNRLDGSTYVVKLCRAQRGRGFSFDWMVDQCRALMGDEGH